MGLRCTIYYDLWMYATTLCKLIGLNFEQDICLDNNKGVIPLLLRKRALQKIDKNRTFCPPMPKKELDQVLQW